MEIYYTSTTEEDIKEINTTLEGMKEFSVTLPRYSRNGCLYVSNGLKYLLKSIYKEELFESLDFIINELISNASKANLKKIYFKKKGLDITNSVEYKLGMRNFLKETSKNIKNYEENLIKEKKYIKIDISISNNSLDIKVENNNEALDIETKNINRNISISRKFNTLNEVYENTNNYNEGPGYGLMIVVLLLRKHQLKDSDLVYNCSNTGTIFSISIPLDLITESQGKLIAKEIVKEINSMPQFPDNIRRLQMELDDPYCSFHSISEQVLADSNLAGEVLRIANSPIYRGNEKTEKISVAVNKIGLLGLRSILYNYGAAKVLSATYNLSEINSLKDHQFSVALISSYLASLKKMDVFKEDVFVAGLLHDIGKMIVNALSDNLASTIEKICKEKNLPISVIDSLSEGYNHSLIGALLAEKWNFPDKYINAIKYHHSPLDSPEEHKAICYAVYMGNELFHCIEQDSGYSNINKKILEFFNLQNSKEFSSLKKDIMDIGIFL